MNIQDKVSGSARDDARIDRQRATNPPDEDPGMGDIDWDTFADSGPSTGGSPWGDSAQSTGDPWGASSGGAGGDPWGAPQSGWGGGAGDPFSSPFGVPQQPEKKEEELEDKIFNGMGKFLKGFFTFIKEFVESFKTFNYMNQLKMGRFATILGGVIAALGLFLTLFGFGTSLGLPFLVGGLLSTGIGVITFMIAYDTFKKNGGEDNPEAHLAYEMQPPQGGVEPENEPLFEPEDVFPESQNESPWDVEDEDEYPMNMDEEDEDEYLIFDEDEEDFDTFNHMVETDPEVLKSNMNTTLDNLDNNNGMFTRQFLYEKVDNVLAGVNPNFDKAREIDEDSDEFDAWDAVIKSSAELFKPRGNDIDYPNLLSAKEKIFYTQLEVSRVNWLKNIDQFVKEIVNICAYDEKRGVMNTAIYGVSDTVGDRIFIKIMKGETAMVSIKDMYNRISGDVQNTKHLMPIVLGVDAEGNIIWRDFKDINSILVTGMPRSGKSWFVLSVVAQMAFFMKPSELQFYVMDPKDLVSDFRKVKIPHVRKFVSTDESILSELRHIVRVEGPRRKQIIGGAGFVNIWDYKKKHPDVDLPLLYVLIDEVVTLAERMDKDTKDEFQGLLLELVSQLPALGIRIFMIPHMVKDQVLKKSITDLIPCRVSVRGDAEHVERSVGTRNFKHKLIHQGDMAVRFNNDDPLFVHAGIITPTNEGNDDLFEFLTKFWLKLDPEGYEGSLHWQEANPNFNRGISTMGGHPTNSSQHVSQHVSQQTNNQHQSQPRQPIDITVHSPSNASTQTVPNHNQQRQLTSSEVTELLNEAHGTTNHTNQPKTSNKDVDDDEIFDLFD